MKSLHRRKTEAEVAPAEEQMNWEATIRRRAENSTEEEKLIEVGEMQVNPGIAEKTGEKGAMDFF